MLSTQQVIELHDEALPKFSIIRQLLIEEIAAQKEAVQYLDSHTAKLVRLDIAKAKQALCLLESVQL